MGRFYRTSNTLPVDYMYRINTPLLEHVLATNEGYIDQELGQANKLGELTQFNHLLADDAPAKKISDDYMTQIDAISSAINKDPANWRKHVQPIKDLTRDLQDNYRNGAISKYVSNYEKRKADFDAIDKQVELYHKTGGQDKDGNALGIAPERAAAYKQKYDSEFTGTDYKDSNTYNPYKGGQPMDDINVKKVIADGLDKLKADSTKEWHSNPAGNDWYFDKVTNKRVEVTPERVLQIAMSNIKDPKLLKYLKEDSNVGLVRGVYDETGNLIAPYDYSKPGISPDEQAGIKKQEALINQIKDPKQRQFLKDRLANYSNQLENRSQLKWNQDSYFTPILQGLIGKNAYSETESGNDLTNNSKGGTMFREGQANYRQGRTLRQQLALHNDTQKNIMDRFGQTQDEKIREFDINQNRLRAGKSGTTKGKDEAKTNPIETTIAPFATNSFESKFTTTRDNETVPKLSVKGLSADIDANKNIVTTLDKQISDINSQLKDIHPDTFEYNSLNLKKNQLELLRNTTQKDLDDTRYYYKKTTEQVLANNEDSGIILTPNEVKVYKEFETDRNANKLSKEIEEARKRFPNIPDKIVSAGTGAVGQQTYKPAPQVQELLDKRKEYLDIHKRVTQGKDNLLANVRRDYIDADAIVPNEKESLESSEMILANTEGLKLYDKNGRKPALNFAGGLLKDYMDKNGVTMTVLKIAPTTAIGSGRAVAQVIFSDPNNKVRNTPYYIELTDALQSSISNKFKTHKNPEVSRIATSMGDGLDNSIRNQLAPLALNESFGENSSTNIKNTHHISLKVPDWQGNTGYVDVIKYTGGALHVSVKNKDGQVVDLPSTNGKPGFFDNTDDFIQQYKIYIQKMKEINEKIKIGN